MRALLVALALPAAALPAAAQSVEDLTEGLAGVFGPLAPEVVEADGHAEGIDVFEIRTDGPVALTMVLIDPAVRRVALTSPTGWAYNRGGILEDSLTSAAISSGAIAVVAVGDTVRRAVLSPSGGVLVDGTPLEPVSDEGGEILLCAQGGRATLAPIGRSRGAGTCMQLPDAMAAEADALVVATEVGGRLAILSGRGMSGQLMVSAATAFNRLMSLPQGPAAVLGAGPRAALILRTRDAPLIAGDPETGAFAVLEIR